MTIQLFELVIFLFLFVKHLTSFAWLAFAIASGVRRSCIRILMACDGKKNYNPLV